MKFPPIIVFFVTLFFSAACVQKNENIYVQKAMLVLKFEEKSTDTLNIKLFNPSQNTGYFYDSLFLTDERLPNFFWVRVCKEDIKACEKTDWTALHYRSSSVLKLPIDHLTSIEAGGEKNKYIRYEDLLNEIGVGVLSQSYLIQFKLRIFTDVDLQSYNDYESDWLFQKKS